MKLLSDSLISLQRNLSETATETPSTVWENVFSTRKNSYCNLIRNRVANLFAELSFANQTAMKKYMNPRE